ncbi:Zinc finger RING/FYVE/PHD-type protein [Dioscorea alata]|uniref:Zinc finger RING/FYVE/PHD-type protein n=1 Tax=Dioscorea alata TaxID=55571 RepID=A0ACB7U147_DIOAL|nr:Zinc finger RING/FYVE/PHD-type protein [Dioscorea alata]
MEGINLREARAHAPPLLSSPFKLLGTPSMAVSSFPMPIPLPSPPSSPALSDADLLRSLLRLSKEIAHSEPPGDLFRRGFASVARKIRVLSVIFEDLQRDRIPRLRRSAELCFKEILVVLQHLKALLADCSARSRMRLLLQSESLSNDLRELTLDLSTMLDILPMAELDLSEDVRELVDLLRRQCRRSDPPSDLEEESLRLEIQAMIREIENEIVPDRERLEKMFDRLGLIDSRSCSDEIECLEREIGDRVAENLTPAMLALVGLIRYGKCVLFGASTPRSVSAEKPAFLQPNPVIPDDFRCPISLDLMRDPVVVSSGQTYDRDSITRWISSGHATCPKTGQTLDRSDLVSNRALKNLISRWCREENVPYDSPESGNGETNGVSSNKAALEAARMTASFLVEKLAASQSTETANRVVHELRQLTKTSSESRAFAAEAGAIPLLLPLLNENEPSLQLNAVTALLNLSILDTNKRRIMHTDGALDALLRVLSDGATWQAKQNSATTLRSLSVNHSYRRRLGRNPRVLEELVNLVKVPPASKDALLALHALAGDRANIGKLVESGAVTVALESLVDHETAEEATALLAAIAKRGGASSLASAKGSIKMLVRVLRHGSESAQENAAAALVLVCRRTGGAAVAEITTTPGIEWAICEVMSSGTPRARRKAASLGRICRRWLAAEEACSINGSAITE